MTYDRWGVLYSKVSIPKTLCDRNWGRANKMISYVPAKLNLENDVERHIKQSGHACALWDVDKRR